MMNTLVLEAINRKAAYRVEQNEQDGFFQFSTLLYICETGDNKQSMRSRLFEYWFSTYNRKSQFTTLSSSIIDREGVINYATIILRNDNPNLSEIITEFSESIQALSQKPE